MTSQAVDLRSRGIAAARAGARAEARALLAQALAMEPNDEQAWLWLSSVVETTEEQRACLERVLAINPQSAPAKRGMQRLGPRPARPPDYPSAAEAAGQ